jgi:Bacterial PH domain
LNPVFLQPPAIALPWNVRPDRVVCEETGVMAKSPAEADEGHSRLTTAPYPYAPAAEPSPMPPQPVPPDGAKKPAAAELREENDIWWGSYSMATMVPSLLVCLLLTGLITWAAWAFVPRRHVQGTILALASAVWLVQGVRWAHRVFGYNYRLTTRRIYADRGFVYKGYAAFDLDKVARVVVKQTGTERLLGVGQVWIMPEDETRPPLVLEGVRRPEAVSARIRELVPSGESR